MSTIITRNSANSGSTPASLVQGELAINVTDGRLFYGSGSGNVVKEFTGSASGGTIDTGSFAITGSNTFTGDQIINGENLGLIVDASGLKRVGFMKYGGLEGSIARVANQNFRILRTTGSNINDGTDAITDFYIAGDGKVGIGTTSPAYTLDVSGSSNFTDGQTIVGNITFPSGSFISSTNISGNIYISTLNDGILHLNDDGGEGDVWMLNGQNKLRIEGDTIITGSIHQSGTFYPNQIDWFSSSIGYDTGSYILTTTANGLTTYANYQDVATIINSGLLTTSSFNAYTGSSTSQFEGTASFATNALSASYAISASYEINYETSSSYADFAVSASHALTASYVNPLHQDVIITGSIYIPNGTNSIYLSGSGAAGRLVWNDTDGTLDLGLKGGNVTLQIGQEEVVRVVNKTGVNLTEAGYQVVRLDGAQGNRIKVALAKGDGDANSLDTLGLVTEDIAINQEGFVTSYGLVRNIDTRGVLQGETWADGDGLYLSPTVFGGITNIPPTAPSHSVRLGYVVQSSPNGSIFVKVDNGYELDELHNVYINTASLAYGDLLMRDGNNVWINSKQLSGSYGLTGSLTISGSSTFTNIGPAIFSGSVTSTGGFTGSLLGTAATASYVQTAQTASYVLQAVSASFATTASYYGGSVTSASYALTASYSNTSTSASYALNATTATTASYVLQAVSASYATQALSASYVPSTPVFPYTGSAEITGSLGVTGSFSVLDSIDAANKILIGSGPIPSSTEDSVNWDSRTLFDSNGNFSVRWGALRTMYDVNVSPSIDWDNRQLKNTSGNEVLNWQSGVTITGSLTVSGSSTLTNIGPARFSGSFVVQGDLIPGSPPMIPDIGPYDAIRVDDVNYVRKLYGSPDLGASASVDFGNRDLSDATGAGVFNWSGFASTIDSRLYINQTISDATRDALVTNVGTGGHLLNEVTFDNTVQVNDLCYLDTTNVWFPVDQSNNTATRLLGICMSYDPMTYVGQVLLEGDVVVTSGAGYPVVAGINYGLTVYIKEAQGTIMDTVTPTTGVVRTLGHCYYNKPGSEWIMKFRPSNDWIVI